MPLVTIAIPTWNRAQLLGETIRSVLDQRFEDFEIRVLDNASTDNTAEVVASIADPRMHYQPSPNFLTLHENLNRCLRAGDAPYLVICHDDDLLLPEYLDRVTAVLDQNPAAVLAHTAFHMINAEGQITARDLDWFGGGPNRIEASNLFIERSLVAGCRINFSTALIRRRALDGLSFDPIEGPAADFGLWLRLGLRGDVAFVSEPSALWRFHSGSISTSSGAYDPARGPDSTFELISNASAVKARFLERSGIAGQQRKRIESSSREQTKGDLLNLVTRLSSPARSFQDTWSLIRRAAQIEKSLFWYPRSARLVLASLLGKKARNAVRRLRSKSS